MKAAALDQFHDDCGLVGPKGVDAAEAMFDGTKGLITEGLTKPG